MPTRQGRALHALMFYTHTHCRHRHYTYVAYVHKAITHLSGFSMCVGSSVAMSNARWFVFGVALFVVLHAGSLCSVFSAQVPVQRSAPLLRRRGLRAMRMAEHWASLEEASATQQPTRQLMPAQLQMLHRGGALGVACGAACCQARGVAQFTW